MADVLVDASVWIAYLRKASRLPWWEELEEKLDERSAVLLDVTVAELLVGARGARERNVIIDLARSLRRPPLDCVIAAVAARDGLLLWTLDEDFEPLVEDGALRRFRAGRG